MKTYEEIEALALELYPDDLDYIKLYHSRRFFRMKLREAFIKGYELCQNNHEQKLLLIEMGKEHKNEKQ